MVFYQNLYNRKQLLDSVFVITLTSTLIVPDITKTRGKGALRWSISIFFKNKKDFCDVSAN